VATFTPVYLNSADYFHNRGLVQGLAVTDVNATNVHLDGRFLSWNVANIGALCVVKSEYFTWNSGWFNIEQIWDTDLCQVFVDGSPVDGGVFFYIDYVPNRPNLVQCARLFGFTGDFVVRALPPAPASYWLTLPAL
jgi:hypothetical protein